MVAWSTTDKSANVVLSGGNLTASWNSAVQGGVRCDTSFAGGLLYFELYTVSGSLSNLSVGFANATQSLAAQVGNSVNSVGVATGNAIVLLNNITIGAFEHTTSQNTIPYTVCIAINFTSGKIWARPMGPGPGGFWNGSVTADPATGVGGLSLSTLAAGPYFPMIGSTNSSGAIVTARFGAASLWYPVPAGFSTLDTNVQAFEAATKFVSYAVLQPPQAAMSVYKEVSYALLRPPQNAISVYKLVSYAILQPPPTNGRLDYNWPLPRVAWPKPFLEKNGSVGTNPNLFPGTSSGLPPGVQMNDNFPPRRKRFLDGSVPHVIHASTPQFPYLLFASL